MRNHHILIQERLSGKSVYYFPWVSPPEVLLFPKKAIGDASFDLDEMLQSAISNTPIFARPDPEPRTTPENVLVVCHCCTSFVHPFNPFSLYLPLPHPPWSIPSLHLPFAAWKSRPPIPAHTFHSEMLLLPQFRLTGGGRRILLRLVPLIHRVCTRQMGLAMVVRTDILRMRLDGGQGGMGNGMTPCI